MGVSLQAVSKWELDSALPDVNNCVALSRAFGITLSQLAQALVVGEGTQWLTATASHCSPTSPPPLMAGFAQVETPYLYCTAVGSLPSGSFTNVADAGGVYNGQWVQVVSRWVTTVYGKPEPLPRTGY